MDPVARRQFLQDYATIREAEGRGSMDPMYYQSLPDRDLTGRNSAQWRIRARSFRHFVKSILDPEERRRRRKLDILDLGAGNGWMSYRLRQRGHRSVAVDIFPRSLDGLGALRNYPVPIAGITAEFDVLPLGSATFDLAIYNSSFHYSSDYRKTLEEARRCLRPDGVLVIMDSPLYRRREHGEQMKEERRNFFQQTYGFRSDALGSIEFLDLGTVHRLSNELGLEWKCHCPWYGWRWALRPLEAKFRRRRPPSRFVLLEGRFRER